MRLLLLSIMGMVLLRAEGGSSRRGKEKGAEIINTIPEGFSTLLKMVNGYLNNEDVASAFAFSGIYVEPANDVDNNDACGDPAVSDRNITVRLFIFFLSFVLCSETTSIWFVLQIFLILF